MVLRKLAIKRLTASDLTFFEWQFRNRYAGNQKAINLNADVFINELYPGLPSTATGIEGKRMVDLSIYGPGLGNEYNLQRKIVKGASYKNWRLDGEFVYDPPEEPGRFDVLTEGDLAVIEFFGDTQPSAVRMVLVAGVEPEDAALHSALSGVVSAGHSMTSLTPNRLAQLVEDAGTRIDHPINDLVSLETTIEVATLGVAEETAGYRSPPAPRRTSRDVLQRARSNANRVGELGEQFINSHLTILKANGQIEGFEWVSRENAVSPYDFRTGVGGDEILLDAKATELSFDNKLHISFSELRQMAYGTERYDLYRVFDIGETTAKLSVAEDLGEWARGVLEIFEGLPEGVDVESVTVSPSILPFGPTVEINMLEEPEEQKVFE